MTDIVFNIGLGKVRTYAELGAAADALILIPLEASGLETDNVLRDADTFAAVVSGATNEQSTAGRKTLASVTITVNDTDNRVDIDAANVTWTAPTGNAVGAFVICYDPDSGTGTDADLIPLTMHRLSWTPDGNDFQLTIADWFRANSAA